MAALPLANLVQELSQGLLLGAEGQQELAQLHGSFPDPRDLARELIKRGWLTPFQVNQLAQGRGKDLVLGPYVLLERLGEGGMGQVFKARHTYLNRHVALKLISKDHLDSKGSAERFLLEMQLVARLDHPHIVRALDAGQAGGRYYLSMELLEGPTLSQLVQRSGPLPWPQACAFVAQAALGLQHASEHGLVHRDIKPSNLMLAAPKHCPPAVKVLDLGLARPRGGDSMRDLTQTGTVMGTMDYLAPEQALDPRTVDIRADLYSLGCTLYFLLAGRAPFHGGTEAQKLLQHQQQDPPGIETLRPDVPSEVSAILRKMLAKRPGQRFQTPQEAADALRPFAGAADARTEAAPGAINKSLLGTASGSLGRGKSVLSEATIMPPAASASPPVPVAGAAPDVKGDRTVPSAGSVPPGAPVSRPGWARREDEADSGPTMIVPREPRSSVNGTGAAPGGGLLGRRPPVTIAILAAAALLLALGVWLLVRPSANKDSVAEGTVKGGEDEKPKGDKDQSPKEQPPKEQSPFKLDRPLAIKPGQPMSMARTGEFVFAAYPGGYVAMADKTDSDSYNVWDLTTMKVARTFNAVSGMERPIVMSLDGRWLAGKVGNKVRVCEAATKRLIILPLPDGRADWMEFAGPDRLATVRAGGQDRGIQVWDLKTEKKTCSLPLPDGCNCGLSVISPDGQVLAVPGNNLLAVQELREGARATILALPSPRGRSASAARAWPFPTTAANWRGRLRTDLGLGGWSAGT